MSEPVDRDRVIFLALVALAEVVGEAGGPLPVRPTTGLRALLGLLHAFAGDDRRHYDDFWRECRAPRGDQTQGSYVRGTMTQTAWNGIARDVGAPGTITFLSAIADAKRGGERK